MTKEYHLFFFLGFHSANKHNSLLHYTLPYSLLFEHNCLYRVGEYIGNTNYIGYFLAYEDLADPCDKCIVQLHHISNSLCEMSALVVSRHYGIL